MPIRIEHQPSPYAVGMAAWQSGRGAAKQRQQKYMLDLWQQDRQNRFMEDRQDQRQQWMSGLDAQRGVQRGWQAIGAGLPKIPENAPPAQRRRLEQLYQDFSKLSTGAFGMDENVTGLLGKMLDEINTITGSIPKMDAGEQASRNWGLLNPKTGERGKLGEQPKEGMVLWDYARGQQVGGDIQHAEQAAGMKAQAAALAEQEKLYEEAKSDRTKWLTRRAAIMDDMRKANADHANLNPKLTEQQIMENATNQMISEGWGEMPQFPTLRPGEKPHMGSPALGPEITPITTEAAGVQAGGEAIPNFTVGPDKELLPTAPPTATLPPQARSFEMSVTPVVGEWAGGQDADVTKLTNTLPTPASLGIAETTAPPTPASLGIPEWDRITDADKQRIRGMINQQPEQSLFDRMPSSVQQRILQAYGAASPGSYVRNALDERYPGIQQVAERIFNAPESPESMAITERENRLQKAYYGKKEPLTSPLRQHTQAQYGLRGTGEGVPSDVSKVMAGVEGAGGLAGREMWRQRREAQAEANRRAGNVPITKYGPIAEEAATARATGMDERYASAVAERERKIASREGVYQNPTSAMAAGIQQFKRQSDPEVAAKIAERQSEVHSRTNAARAQAIEQGMARNQRLGKSTPAVQAAILAALRGDTNAQRALDERGIQWRM